MRLLPFDEFKEMFRGAKRAFHLELRDEYNVTKEDEPFRKWCAGEPDDYAWIQNWLRFMRDVTDEGASVQRVRVFTEPPTKYVQWEISMSPMNIAAGEDVRYLPRLGTSGIDIPADDYWLFNEDELVLSVFV